MAPRAEPGVHVDLPQLLRLRGQAEGFSFLPRQPVHSVLAGRRASRLRGRGLDFEELRGYVPGDDIRSIDWHSTARLGEAFVRVFREERGRTGLFVVDQRSQMFFGTREQMKSVTAAEAAALGAWRMLAQQDRVGALLLGDQELCELRPQRSRRAVLRLLHELVRLGRQLPGDASGPPQRSLDDALEAALRVARHDALVTIISDLHDAGPRTAQLVTRLARHNDVLVVHVYDEMERALPSAGRVVFGEPGAQLEVDTHDGALRTRFAEEHASRVERARRFLLHRRTPMIPLHTGGDVAAQVRKHLGLAGPRRRRR